MTAAVRREIHDVHILINIVIHQKKATFMMRVKMP
jgi:hypothetical protein